MMARISMPSLALALLSSLTSVSAFWRMECRGMLGTARIDPLANFGEVSYHAHNLFGAQDIAFSSTPEDVAASSCTSCIVTQDKSNYWTPTLYFMGDDGSFTQVEDVGGMLAYYLLYGDNITAFPTGFQMISGDTNRRNFSLPVPDPPKSDWTGVDLTQPSLAQKAVGWNCLNYAATPEASLYRHSMPNKTYMDTNCPDGMRLELMFPSCWNGETDSANHKDHVAFPDQVMTGSCPDDYPQRLPSLFYETIYNTAAFKGQSGQFVLSNGDATGNGYHGDFMMGWDESFLQQAVDTCTNPSGEVEDCAMFTLQSDSDAQQCTLNMPTSIAKENVAGPMNALPGNVEVTYGPAPAADDETGSNPGDASSVVTSQVSSQTAVGYTPASSKITDQYGGGIFAQASTTSTPAAAAAATTPATTPAATPATTPAPASSSPVADDEEKVMYTSVYTSAGQEVHLVMVEEDVTVTMPAAEATAAAAKQKRHQHVHRHLRHGRGF